MSIETRIQAINDHLIDDYKVLRLAGADLTGVNKNIVNLKMSWKERLLYFMNNGTDEVWNNWDKVTGSGTTLSINGTVQAPMSLVYKGNTYQSGTPTPTSPIPVQVVSGDNTIKVEGKNLFNESNMYKGYYLMSGTTPNFTLDNSYRTMIIENLPAGTYTFSTNLTNCRILRYYFDNTNTEHIIDENTLTFTTTTKSKVMICFRKNPTSIITEVFNTMLEKGNQATTYEEYKGASYPINLGDIELCKIGTYQDKIFKNTPNTTDYNSELEDNVWYLKKEIGKVVLNGSENWYQWGTDTFYITKLSSVRTGLSNYFKYNSTVTGASQLSNGEFFIHDSTNNNVVIFRNSSYATVADFKTWLTTHNTEVYYVLDTPTYDKITDTTLISQLEALKKSYDSQTNISQTNNDLPFELSVVALSNE